MKLFNLNNYKVEIEPEVLLLAPFAVLWNRDKTAHKKVAFNEIAYVWFMQDVKSDFFAIVNADERCREVSKVIDLPKGWTPDKAVKDAEEFYKKASESLTYRLLQDSRSGLEKLSEAVKDPDFTKVDLKKIAEVILMLPKLSKSLDELEEAVIKERQVVQHRGSQERAIFEDGI